MKYTARTALEKSITLWEYLAAHPDAMKHDAYKALALTPDCQYCPLCEYTFNSATSFDAIDNRCNNCPVWPAEHFGRFGCDNPAFGDFYAWRTAESCSEERKIATENMLRILRITLENLKEESPK